MMTFASTSIGAASAVRRSDRPVLLRPGRDPLGRARAGPAFFGLNLTLRSRAFFHSLRAAYPAVDVPVAAHLGRVLRGGGLQQRRAGAWGGHHQAVPDALLDPGLDLSDGGGRVLRGVDLRRERGRDGADLRVHQGVFPKPPDFSRLSSFDISYLAEHFRFTLFLLTALAMRGWWRSRCCRCACARSGRASARA